MPKRRKKKVETTVEELEPKGEEIFVAPTPTEPESPTLEPQPEPEKIALPTPPKFVDWTYTVQEIEEFRKNYKKFLTSYEEVQR